MSKVLDRSAAAAAEEPSQTPHAHQRKPFNLSQAAIAKEFCDAYGFEASQISFDGDRDEPIFDFEALSILALKLSDIQDINIEMVEADDIRAFAQSRCVVLLADGRMRRAFAAAMVGETMPDSGTVADLKAAMEVSRARALRVGLRMVGFNPVRAHRECKETGQTKLGEEPDQRSKELAEIHLLAERLEFIKGADKSIYYSLIKTYFPNVHSSADMDEVQRAQWIGLLRAWSRAREVAGTLADVVTPKAA